MALASSVRCPHLLLITHIMILCVSLWFHIHISKMRELRGRSEFAKSTFSAFSAVPTLDSLQPHQMHHNLVKDLHVFGSYVTGQLPREHPHVADTTHDDRAEEGVFLGNDLTTFNFWMNSFRAKQVMMLSDPKHWDHILPFMQPGDVPYRIALTDADIRAMHAVDGHEDGDVPVDVVTTR
jgi:hypothetical protein